MRGLLRYRYSFVAGAFAAGGSFFGKLPSLLVALELLDPDSLAMPTVALHFYLEFALLRALPWALMVVCNLLNWRYFLKALQMSEQTLTATVLTAASNYVISLVLAAAVYKEPFTMMSFVGSMLIVLGLWFLCDTTGDGNKEKLT